METARHRRSPADEAILADLSDRLRTGLAFHVTAAEPIVTGYPNNNRLLRLHAADGRSAVGKLYYRDDRRRLEREFDTLRYLRARGVARIPTPLLRCDRLYAAVYTDEAGVTKPAGDLTTAETTEIGRFLADLHRVRPEEPGADFPAAVAAADSWGAKIFAIRQRLQLFTDAAADPGISPQVRTLCAAIDVAVTLERLLAATTAGLDTAALAAAYPPEGRRLDSGDFAPHNVLVRPDGSVCVLDFEYAGWDQPLASLAYFLTAATSLDLRPEAAAAFLNAYGDAAGVPRAGLADFDRLCALHHLFWCGVHLSLTTPAHLARKRFANPDLDVEAVTADQIGQFRRRLVLAEAAVTSLHGASGTPAGAS